MKVKSILLIGISFIVTGILLGAFGAHALKALISPEKLVSFETGVRYQLINGLGLILIGGLMEKYENIKAIAIRLMIAGIILFSGSIYLLSLQEMLAIKMSFLGPITPIGGSLLIVAWSLLFLQILKNKQ